MNTPGRCSVRPRVNKQMKVWPVTHISVCVCVWYMQQSNRQMKWVCISTLLTAVYRKFTELQDEYNIFLELQFYTKVSGEGVIIFILKQTHGIEAWVSGIKHKTSKQVMPLWWTALGSTLRPFCVQHFHSPLATWVKRFRNNWLSFQGKIVCSLLSFILQNKFQMD